MSVVRVVAEMEYHGAHGDLRSITLRRLLLRHNEFGRVHKQETKTRMALAGAKVR